MRACPVKEQPSGKMSPETFGPGVYTFPRNWEVRKQRVDDFKGNDKVPLAHANEKQIKHQPFVRQSIRLISSIAFYEICLVLKLLNKVLGPFKCCQ